MARICFIMLCHQNPADVVTQARMLAAQGDCVVVHYDRSANGFDQIRRALRHDDDIALARRRRCGWGDWSLVGATLEAARTGLRRFPDATHVYLVSGECLPLVSAARLHATLDSDPRDHIETRDFHRSGWIKTGLQDERLVYRHYFNERRAPRMFYGALALQRYFGWARPLPRGLDMRIGSQWWCLRRATVQAVLTYLARRRDVLRFFRTIWIPDECAIQTLVWHLVPEEEIANAPPTLLMFTDYGMPVTFHNDHIDILSEQQGFFVRKVSPRASDLRAALAQRWAAAKQFHNATPPPDVRVLRDYVTRRGRVGLRTAPRAWEAQAAPAANADLWVVLCKKWSIGKRLSAQAGRDLGILSLGYLFDEVGPDDPALGGLEGSLVQRREDPPSFLRLVMEVTGQNRLVFCLDPCRVDILQALQARTRGLRVLELQCQFSDEDLTGHATRLGLLNNDTDGHAAQLWPMLRRELQDEAARLAAARIPGHFCLRDDAPTENVARTIADFLQVPHQKGHDMARRPGLFHD